ncbi:ureidoglycolate lyase [Oceanicella sp. SM1341]|uniref:ureidoglycolate lyase n=1 Tax=Oceanicella sp. SM1341 TaxID=1548889 RepID=UPI000E4961C0|nr:ureidoglycolate lyase [Oceanicella sp. SM1341]
MTQLPSLAPLTAEAFAPYGSVIAHEGSARRHPVRLEHGDAARPGTVASWVSRIGAPLAPGATVTAFERHPHSDQAFVPLSGQRYLVLVCDGGPDDRPDPATARAFLAGPGQGVVYRRNTWHAGMQVFDAPAEFFVQMKRVAEGADDEFVDIAAPLSIPFPEEAPA